MTATLYIGIMSGTSLDGIDLVLVDFAGAQPHLVSSLLLPFPQALHTELRLLAEPGDNEVERIGPVEQQLAECYAAGVQQLLQQAQRTAQQVKAIGCHGQTIRHRPNQAQPFTLQLGNMHLLAALTGIRVIADFRRKDMAYGGQGAPLVPAFHQAVFAAKQQNRAVVNIGGIANISVLYADGRVTGYDTGPGNCLMDDWVAQQRQLPYDKDGAFSREGKVLPELLALLLSDNYFQQAAPKSTGREYFHLGWLQPQLPVQASAADVQRTLCRFTAQSIANELKKLKLEQVFVCGGGVHHPLLMTDLAELLAPTTVSSSSLAGIEPDWVEAIAFAWLAFAFDRQLPGNLPAVTGARKACVLGVEYRP